MQTQCNKTGAPIKKDQDTENPVDMDVDIYDLCINGRGSL